MTFDELLTQIVELLQHQGRVSYGALRRRFDLDDEYVEDIKTELIQAQRIAADEGGKVLVWIKDRIDHEWASGRTGKAGLESSVQRLASEGRGRTPTVQTLDSRRSDPRPNAAERRQLTVMFCELGRAVSVEEKADPEDWQESLRLARRVCEEVVGRYEGSIAQSLGDGLIVYFGYPRAHEDDARRAVQAGLDIVRVIQRLDRWPMSGLPLAQVRVGIHTGQVVVGTTDEQQQLDTFALGLTPQIAVHLLGVAEPNTVVLGPTTFRLVEGYFACRSLGEQLLENLNEPLDRYLVLRESGARHRLEAATMAGFTPLIGREEEGNLLRKRWEQVQEHYGQVVLLSGEAGIGKSRLIQELKEQLAQEPCIWIEARCSPYHQQSALYPVIDYIQRSLQFGREETGEEKRQKLERTMTRAHLQDAIPLFANLLSLPSAPSVYSNMAPQRQYEKVLQVIVAWFLSLTKLKPVVTVWEDLHWADPSTLALLQLLIEHVPTTPILTVLTFRPEFTPPWLPRSHMTSLMLGRLGSRHAEEMIEHIAKGKALPPEVTAQIVNKTDGVPLFVEELTKMVLESGLVKEESDAYHLTGPLPPLAIPATLQDSLLARLDRLAAAREVAQVGAVLGREFAPEVLHAVLGSDEDTVSRALERLVSAEVLYRRGIAPRVRYVFKHALIQDVAYQSLVQGRRQQYHQQIARIFEERFPETKKTQPEIIAHHYTEAGVAALAVPAWQTAGQNAIERSAFVEAAEHLQKGLAVLKTLPETPDRDQQELQLAAMLGPVLMALKGYSAPDVEKTYTQALTLCRRIGDTPRLFQVLLGLEIFYFTRGELATARQLGEQCLSLVPQKDNSLRLLQARVMLANILFYQGEFVSVDDDLQQAMLVYNAERSQGMSRTLQDPGVNALSYLSWTLWCLGYPDRAMQKREEALAVAGRLGWPLSQAMAFIFACGLGKLRKEEFTALQYAERVMSLATEQGFVLWAAYGKIVRGWALGQQGNLEEGIVEIQQGIASIREIGAEAVLTWFLLMLAETYEKARAFSEGLSVIAQALEVVERHSERAFAAELYRIKGELTLQKGARGWGLGAGSSSPQAPSLKPQVPSGVVEEVEECFLEAIDIARQQHAKSWELRAVMSLVRVRLRQVVEQRAESREHRAENTEQGVKSQESGARSTEPGVGNREGTTRTTQHLQCNKLAEAHQMLASVYNWFTEGFDTKDLQEAKMLLESLESTV